MVDFDPLTAACPKCHAPAGAKCKNWKGQNKFTCKVRLAGPPVTKALGEFPLRRIDRFPPEAADLLESVGLFTLFDLEGRCDDVRRNHPNTDFYAPGIGSQVYAVFRSVFGVNEQDLVVAAGDAVIDHLTPGKPPTQPALPEPVPDSAPVGCPEAVAAVMLSDVPGLSPYALKKLFAAGELRTVGQVWDWVEEDGALDGGIADPHGVGLFGVLRGIGMSAAKANQTSEAFYSFLRTKGADPRVRLAPYTSTKPRPVSADATYSPAPEPLPSEPVAPPEPDASEPRIDLYNCDCITGMREHLAPGSVDLVVTSIPFEELFSYSGKPEDVGNNGSTVDVRAGRFALNMRFVADSIRHALRPGANCCVHIQQLLAYKVQHGYTGRRDFRGAMIDVFGAAGLLFHGEVAVPKNPQAMANRLNLHSLQFKTGYARDSSLLAPAPNDYVLIFRSPGGHPCPPKAVRYKHHNPGGWVGEEEWIAWARGVWADVLEIDVLDGSRGHKEERHEKHVCPLQLEVIRRLVSLYTNPVAVQPDVLVLDPFSGIGSTGYVCAGGASPCTKLALAGPRNFVGFELKTSYHNAARDYTARALAARRTAAGAAAEPSLLDGIGADVA